MAYNYDFGHLRELIKYGIFIKFTDTIEHATDLSTSLYFNSPHFYKQHENIGIGDNTEIDDDYMVWCASYFDNLIDAIKVGWSNEIGHYIAFEGKARCDIKDMLFGNEKMQSIGEYMAIIFKPMTYISRFIEGLYSCRIALSDSIYPGIVQTQLGNVSYCEKTKYNQRLLKNSIEYEYQHEFRLIIDIYKNDSNCNEGLKLNVFTEEYKDILVINRDDIAYQNDRIVIPISKCIMSTD